jgi:hypothetical protein
VSTRTVVSRAIFHALLLLQHYHMTNLIITLFLFLFRHQFFLKMGTCWKIQSFFKIMFFRCLSIFFRTLIISLSAVTIKEQNQRKMAAELRCI